MRGRGLAFFDHLHERVLGEAVLADGGEVGGFPAGAIEILFNLRHIEVFRECRGSGGGKFFKDCQSGCQKVVEMEIPWRMKVIGFASFWDAL